MSKITKEALDYRMEAEFKKEGMVYDRRMWDLFFRVIKEQLIKGVSIGFTNFGALNLKVKPPRKVIVGGKEHSVPERRIVKFTTSKNFEKELNGTEEESILSGMIQKFKV